jgi:hypothetical protein
MSNYKGHLAGGIFAYLIAIYCIIATQSPSFTTGLEWLLFTLAGALFPDVDIKSKGQKLFYWIILILMIVLLINDQTQALIIVAVLGVVPLLVRHRGIFHRLWFVILVPLVVAWILCLYMPQCNSTIMYDCLFFIVGAISHLWLDLGLRRMIGW